MREIKFRAWFSKRQEMIDVESLHFFQPELDGRTCAEVEAKSDFEKGGWYTQLREATNRKTSLPGSKTQIPRVVLMQYTGLTDKNGREIYEGDIVKIINPCAEDIISKVVWGGAEYPAFDLPKYDGYTMNAFSAIRFNGDDEMEVIGNVFEHPHLLEGDN